MDKKTVSGILLTLLLTNMLMLAFNGQPVKAQEEGLIAYYPFNGNANDESGNGNNGTVHGATLTTDRFGNANSAYNFDGSDNYIEVPDDDTLDLSDGLTISAWINSRDTSGARVIVAKWGNDFNRSYIFKDHNWLDKLRIELSKGGYSYVADLEGTNSIILGSWIHVCTTYDSNTVKLYFNGTLDAASPASGSIAIGDASLLIGAVYENQHYFEFFNGVIDDIRIYSRALSENEIQELFYARGYEHELTVSLDAPNILDPSSSSLLNATVYNRGLSNETNVELQLLINGSVIDSVVVSEMLAGSSYRLSHLWTPTVEGIYNVTVCALSLPDENITTNNVDSRYVIVGKSFSFHFRAWIDGSDWVYIRDNEVWYVHRNYDYPGIHDVPEGLPTYINGDPWYPEWPDDYGYDDYGQRSLNTYTDLCPPLYSVISLTIIEARHSISIVQYPSFENDYTTIILLDDDPPGGAAWYEFELSYISTAYTEYTLTTNSLPAGVTFTVDSVSRTTPWLETYFENASFNLIMPENHFVGDARYYWSQWSDGNTSRSRTVTMTTNITLTAHYTGPHYKLTVTSSPITNITFTMNETSETTPCTEWLPEGSYTMEMPRIHEECVWSHWLEDGDTNKTKTVTLSGSTMLTGVFTLLGDLSGDDKVRVDDLLLAVEAFGTDPDHPRWNPAADVTGDSRVRVDDMLAIALNFGNTLPTPIIETHPANAMWIEPSTVDLSTASMSVGDRFNVTVWLNLTETSASWEFKMLYNRDYLNATGCGYTAGMKSQFFENITTISMSPVFGEVNATHNYVLTAECRGASGPFRNPGSGSLAWVEFEVVAVPEEGQTFTSTLDISTYYPDETYAQDLEQEKIPLTVYDCTYKINAP